MSNPPYSIIETSDGSHSVYLSALKETYHSSHGAVTESLHVFIEKGLDYYVRKNDVEKINIFEVGFGTGLNALLTLQWAEKNNRKVSYHTIEGFPLPVETLKQLNYSKYMDNKEVFKKLHNSPWNVMTTINDFFSILKISDDWRNYPLQNNYFHGIFYDAFAPSRQPDMWEYPLVKKSFDALVKGGVLTTYCAQGQFKRDVVSSGFILETLGGPPGKKEMVRGTK